MAALTIRKLDDGIKARLRLRAAQNGHSVEEEARLILGQALSEPRTVNSGQRLIEAFRDAFGPLGGVELELPSRESDWKPPTFDR
jgi:plasmid stability protein